MNTGHTGPKQARTFLDKYLAVLAVAVLLISSTAFGQAADDTSQVRQSNTSYGFDYQRFGVKKLFKPPFDTLRLKISDTGSIVVRGTTSYVWTTRSGVLRWDTLAGGPGGAYNGLTFLAGKSKLGGPLTENTDISLVSDSFRITGAGYARFRVNAPSAAAFIFENTAPGFKDNTYFIGDNVPIRLFARASNGFPGISYHSGPADSLRWSTGYDGNFDHGYLADIRATPSVTVEVDGQTFAAFTRGKVFGIGNLPARDTAKITIYTTGSYTGMDSTNRWIVGQNYGSTFNTTGGAIINAPLFFDNSSTRLSGGNNLTNRTLWLRARNGQFNQALFIDSGNAVIRGIGSNTAVLNVASFFTLANLTVNQDRYAGWFENGRTLTDTLGGTQTLAAGLRAGYTYAAKGYAVIPDNLSGVAIDARLSLVANHTGYTGRTFYQGALIPANGVTTMSSAISAGFSMAQTQSGANSVRASGWWAGVSSQIFLSTGDSVGRFAFFNGGAGQWSGGKCDTCFIYYANALAADATNKYAFYNVGAADSNVFNGITKVFNLQADKTITAGGTTGDQIINKISGTVNFAAGATTITVTNSFVLTSSNVFCTVRTNDATAYIKNVAPNNGSFVITLGAAATAETSVGFFVMN